jgi:hypothetical protein
LRSPTQPRGIGRRRGPCCSSQKTFSGIVIGQPDELGFMRLIDAAITARVAGRASSSGVVRCVAGPGGPRACNVLRDVRAAEPAPRCGAGPDASFPERGDEQVGGATRGVGVVQAAQPVEALGMSA